jgi:PAS domain S-box-containing protein
VNVMEDVFAEHAGPFLPPDEDARLHALREYQILDTLPEAAFDNIARLAARIFEVPICLVSLIDRERQWFKSCVGLDIKETSREVAFCSHAILSDEVLVVPDATRDPRFGNNPSVTGSSHIRFYAGAPLITPQGLRLGTLCLIDDKPREFSDAARSMLRDLASLVMDELELRRTQHALQDNAAYFRALIENAGDIITVLDDDGTILFESPAVQGALGYAPEELTGRNAFEFVHPDDAPLVQERFGQVAATPGLVSEVEFRFRHRDGTWRYLEARGAQLPNNAPQRGVVVNSRDVTRRKDAEKALRESQAHHGAVIETSLDAILTMDAEGKVLEWNPAAERIFGYERGEAVGSALADLIVPPALREAHRAGMARYLANGEKRILDSRVELTALRKDGSEILVELIATRLPTAGAPIFTGFMRDITQSKRSEERLRLLESVAVNANDAILITEAEPIGDPGPRILYANPAFTRETGYSLEEVVGKTPRILQGPETDRAALDTIRAGLEKWQPVVVELVNYKKDGTKFWVELSIVPVADEAGWYTHWVSVQRVVTERKTAQQQLQIAKDEAERAQRSAESANRAKSEFLSRMSHELRTPLNAILGFSQVMQMEPLDGGQREMVGDIMSAGKHLLALINEVLDIARIESGHLALSLEPVALDEVVSGALNLIAPLAAARGIVLEASETCDGERFVMADFRRLSQCLLNLLSNAVKYNCEGGRIEVSCQKVEAQVMPDSVQSRGCWRLEVRDSGIGIEPEKMARLFTAFDRLDAERTGVEGTGLGLALTKQLVEAMHGKLEAESVPGSGSTFAVTLPLCEAAALSASLTMPASFGASGSRRTVLYIEDNPHNLKVVESVLAHRPQIKLMSTTMGATGLESAAFHQPDLILLDLHLSDMAGEEVLRGLQENPQTCSIPVVVVSADATPRQIEDLSSAGARDYLTKPLDVPEFLGKLDEILR